MLIYSVFLTFLKFASSCQTRVYQDGLVCVCNATNCDRGPVLENVFPRNYQIFSSSKESLGFRREIGTFTPAGSHRVDIEILPNELYQKIIGFGGHFTDAAGINLNHMSKAVQLKILDALFSNDGIGYSLGRVPIGSTEFSLRPYSHANFTHSKLDFKLQHEDLTYKIPHILDALERNPSLNLVTSARSAPPWMKTNNDWCGTSVLRPQYYQMWTEYQLKFFEEYERFNISFWGAIVYDRPMEGYLPCSWVPYSSMGFLPYNAAEWIVGYLGPLWRSSKYNETKVMVNECDRVSLYTLQALLKNETVLKYIDGVTMHTHLSSIIPVSEYKFAKSPKKDTFLLESEMKLYGPVSLGKWATAEIYIETLFEILEYGIIGFMDGNMIANLDGGPSYLNYSADAVIIVNKTSDEFYKQPTYYAMGHFSKFITANSQRIGVKIHDTLDDIKVLAFKRPDKRVAVVLYNRDTVDKEVSLKIGIDMIRVILEPNSINTVVMFWGHDKNLHAVDDEGDGYLFTVFVTLFVIVLLILMKSE